MTDIILLRGPSGVGKSAIAKALTLHLKKEMKKDCAYISEDDFRKQMQFKYKAEDKKAHTQSVKIIKSVITELTNLDKYDLIVIEGLFRYSEMVKEYSKFCLKNKFNLFVFQLFAPLEVRIERNKISNVRNHISNLDSEHGKGKGEEITLSNSITLDTTKTIEESIKSIISNLPTLSKHS